MADFAGALRTRLVDDAAVAGLVGSRIYWAIAAQNAALPYIRLQTISDERPQHLAGYDGARVTRVQADCFAATHAGAQALAQAVLAAMAGPATVAGVSFGRTKAEGPRDLGEDVPGKNFVHRASLDLLAEHDGD